MLHVHDLVAGAEHLLNGLVVPLLNLARWPGKNDLDEAILRVPFLAIGDRERQHRLPLRVRLDVAGDVLAKRRFFHGVEGDGERARLVEPPSFEQRLTSEVHQVPHRAAVRGGNAVHRNVRQRELRHPERDQAE